MTTELYVDGLVITGGLFFVAIHKQMGLYFLT